MGGFGSPILMAYIITNKSGNRCGVSKEKYEELITQDGYTGEIIDSKTSSDYTISELRDMKGEMDDSEWESFTANDTRKSISSI